MEPSVLIVIHSYRNDPNGRSVEYVTLNRVRTALDAARRYDRLGATVGVVYLGGYDPNGRTTAERTRDIAAEHVPDLDSAFVTMVVNQHGDHTRAEIQSFAEVVDELNPELVVSVSSRDRFPESEG